MSKDSKFCSRWGVYEKVDEFKIKVCLQVGLCVHVEYVCMCVSVFVGFYVCVCVFV